MGFDRHFALHSPAADQNVAKSPSWQSLTWTSTTPRLDFLILEKIETDRPLNFFQGKIFPESGKRICITRSRFAPITGSKSKAWGGLPPS
jgi:hypothetical protein